MSLINKKKCKAWTMDAAARLRPHHKFTRVSASVFDTIEACVRDKIRSIVESQPSKGKTIQ